MDYGCEYLHKFQSWHTIHIIKFLSSFYQIFLSDICSKRYNISTHTLYQYLSFNKISSMDEQRDIIHYVWLVALIILNTRQTSFLIFFVPFVFFLLLNNVFKCQINYQPLIILSINSSILLHIFSYLSTLVFYHYSIQIHLVHTLLL